MNDYFHNTNCWFITTIIKWPPKYEVRPLCLFTRIYHEEFHALCWLYSTSTLPKTFFLKSLLTQSILNRFLLLDYYYLNLKFVFLLEYCPRKFTRLVETGGTLAPTPLFLAIIKASCSSLISTYWPWLLLASPPPFFRPSDGPVQLILFFQGYFYHLSKNQFYYVTSSQCKKLYTVARHRRATKRWRAFY